MRFRVLIAITALIAIAALTTGFLWHTYRHHAYNAACSYSTSDKGPPGCD